MSRIALIFILFFVSRWGHAQVLENYEGEWSSSTEQSLVGSIGQKQVKLAVNSFPQSYFKFEVPRNSTVFVDGKLWGLIQNDTTFLIPTDLFKKEFGKDSLLVTVISDKIRLGDFDLTITKVARNQKEKKLASLEDQFFGLEKRLVVQPVKDFIVGSLFIILAFIAVYRRIYPYLLGVLLQPLSVIKAEDFSESGGLQKVFSFDILYFLFLVSMILAQSLVTGIIIFRPDWIEDWGGLTAFSLLFLWGIASFLLLMLTILKFSVIKFMAYLFDLGKSEFAHFFYLLRLITFSFTLVLVATTFFVINDFSVLKLVFTQLMKGVFWIYLFGVFGLFLIMMNRLSFKKYHLFTYLCLAEIVPFLVLIKWILVLIQ
ncbi:MAG: DUF4271 domain-containing protein [Bacteroidetes bacterium]|nr:DUF4271 domain-containing protein [Bacteroidota bacterium]MDA1267756.1 DUF4271 domain-containing protein [Bacteroidota bacterium]